MADAATTAGKRCGFVAVIGAPNAGKSTLVNALVGTKVTIVSRKVQTTRSTVRGIAIAGDSQLVFIDTPGIFQPKRRLDRAMVDAAWGGAKDADIIAFVVDALKGLEGDAERILKGLVDRKAKCILVLNKVDAMRKDSLLALTKELGARHPFAATFMISALKHDGVEDLKNYLAKAVPEGPWLYDADDITDLPLRQHASEITREKIYDRLHDELPYAITVETTAWTDQKAKGVRIEQTIFVERDSQKMIVIGKGGQTIKQISMDARKEIGSVLERPVHLFLFVKVRDGWEHDPERYREMGLEFPKD